MLPSIRDPGTYFVQDWTGVAWRTAADLAYLWGGFQAKGYRLFCAYSKKHTTFWATQRLEVWLLKLSGAALHSRPAYFVQGWAGVSRATAADLAYLWGGFQAKGTGSFVQILKGTHFLASPDSLEV